MSNPIRVAIIGLDTSHSIEFPRRMQAPDCAEKLRVPGLRAVTCLRFPSAFQSEKDQDTRQAQLVAWGIRPASDLDDAVAEADAIMLEINDPALHQHWFREACRFGKPIFVDKPLADTMRAGAEMIRLAGEKGIRMTTASSLRFDTGLARACGDLPRPNQVAMYGALGRAAAGSSVVWYAVHVAEMLNKAMGRGAVAVTTRRDGYGAVVIVDYGDRRRGVIELNEGVYLYGGVLRDGKKAVHFTVDNSGLYTAQLQALEVFFRGGPAPSELEDAVEIMAILDAAERSVQSGRTEPVQR